MGRPKGTQPSLWRFPNDSVKRAKALGWVRAKCQAKFRGEQWDITEEDWIYILWTDQLWARRGRKSQDLCLIRDDSKAAWSMDNVMIVTRRTQLVIQNYHPEMIEIEPNVWDITGTTLSKWSHNQVAKARYRLRRN